MVCSQPGSSVHGIFQARVLEWGAIAFSRGSSWPSDWTQVSHIVGRFFTLWATREVPTPRWGRQNPRISPQNQAKGPWLRPGARPWDITNQGALFGSILVWTLFPHVRNSLAFSNEAKVTVIRISSPWCLLSSWTSVTFTLLEKTFEQRHFQS